MTTEYNKLLPTIDDVNRPFWDAARQGKLSMQKCLNCQHVRFPISQICPKCLSANSEWTVLSGRGKVHSSIVFHQVYNPAFATDVPYNVSLIQLEEGPRMISNVVGVEPSKVRVGDEVEAVFDPVTSAITIPRFHKKHI